MLFYLFSVLQANPYQHNLTCYYSNVNNNPILILAPAKIEEVYRNPNMVIFHDVVSDKETEIIKMIATPLVSIHNPALCMGALFKFLSFWEITIACA